MNRRLVLAGMVSGLAIPALGRAGPPALDEAVVMSKLNALAEGQLRTIAREPILIEAVAAQNRETRSYSESLIERLDADWRREVYTEFNRRLIPAVMDRPASHFLKRVQELSEGRYTEFVAMDARGLNVALSDLTPDYWQGDEDKFLLTYPLGVSGRHIGPYEYYRGAWQRQLSITIVNPVSLLPVGALCAGVAVELL